jgi:multidrug efflux pump subunit AcrB
MFMEGVIGVFFLQFGITLSIAVMLSYLEAVTLAPAHLAAPRDRSPRARCSAAAWTRPSTGSSRRTRGCSRGPARPSLVVVLSALGVFGARGSCCKHPGRVRAVAGPEPPDGAASTAVGTSVDETDKLIQKAENALVRHPEVDRVWSSVGGGRA